MAFNWGLFTKAKNAELDNQTTTANANANNANAQAFDATQRGLEVKPLADSAINSAFATNAEAGARTGLLGSQTREANDDLSPLGVGGAVQFRNTLQQRSILGGGLGGSMSMGGSSGGSGLAFSKGTDQVPGKDKGKDTVHAMLRPGEAVLVPGAADAVGRDKIAALNAVHNAHDQTTGKLPSKGKAPAGKKPMGKGMIPPAPQASPGAPEHDCMGSASVGYANGTPYVPGLNNGTSIQGAAGPGTTVTSGQWGNGSPTPNQDLRAQMFGPRPVAKPQNFASGTHEVGMGKSKKTPKIDPGVLNALMGMMSQGGGGGAPPPGGMVPPR